MGHPKGLFVLFSTEMWERFSYYGMRAILVLYLTAQTQQGGLGWDQASALQLYGFYTFLVYLTPILGGWLADNILGQRRAVMIGGLLMAIGQFALATPKSWVPGFEIVFFYLGLLGIILGNGMFKPNISTLVGELYQQGDHRRDGAFTIFYMGINLGAAFAPFVVGYLGEKISWHLGFAAAGCGMLLSLAIQFFLAQRYLGDIGRVPSAVKEKAQADVERIPLTKVEQDRIKVILILSMFSVVFWAGYEQAGGLLNLYARDMTDRMLGSYEVPASWFQSVTAIFIVAFAPIAATIWVKMGNREPSSSIKFAMGLIFLGIGYLCMMLAVILKGDDPMAKSSMLWLIAIYFFHVLGELCLSPVGLSMVTKLAPLRLVSLMMGFWFAFTAVANLVAGLVGSLVAQAGPLAVFTGLGAAAIVSGILLYLISDKLIAWMHGAEDAHPKLVDEMKPAEAD